jgi:5S rRNA maturation endonuclease (ribonuclease M5)
MHEYQEITELLHNNKIEYREHSDELLTHCIFNDCDVDSRGTEAHLYINKNTGLYDCKKCGEKGNLVTLKEHFGLAASRPSLPKRMPASLDKQAAIYHDTMPNNIREYLRTERLLSDDIIDNYQLGYMEQHGRRWITIPVTDRTGSVLFMKLRQDPSTPAEGQPKYMHSPAGSDASIYNSQILNSKPDMLVICEGEFDCLVLNSFGIPTICSTAGAATFKEQWISQLGFVRDFYILMDNDDAGRKGAESLIEKLSDAHPNSSVMRVTLPSKVGEHGDVTDFFKQQLGRPDELFTPTGKYVKLAGGIEPIDVSQLEEITLQSVVNTLEPIIKRDNDNKLVTFLCMLSAYTDSSQINVSFNSPSSTGKSYTAIQIASLFPDTDKIKLSGASPTSFFHGEGIFDKERNAKIVSLERKIILLYEQPNPELQAKLRAVLSHDERELYYRITNKDKKGANRAELIIVTGFPATVFCSAGLRLDEQETTRAILLSPEVTTEKIRDGVQLQAERSSNTTDFDERIETQPERIALKNRILAIKREHIDDIVVPNPDEIVRRFNAKFKTPKPRHMRDMNHLMCLIKTTALLNIWYRRSSDGMIMANQSDIDQVFELWGRLIEAQDMNVPPAVMYIYKKYVLLAYLEKLQNLDYTVAMEKRLIGLSRQELSAYYFRKEGSPLNDEQLRKQVLPQLEASGIITQGKPQEGDKRSPHIFPIWYPPEINNPFEAKYQGTSGEVDLSIW